MISNCELVLKTVICVTVMFWKSTSARRSSCISLVWADLDECQIGSFTCHARAVCVNVPGSYSCRCRPGYAGNGKTVCEGKVCPAFPCWNPVVRGERIRLPLRKKINLNNFHNKAKKFRSRKEKNKIKWILCSLRSCFCPETCFSRVPKNFRPQKVIRKTQTRLLCKAGLFTCCKGNRN